MPVYLITMSEIEFFIAEYYARQGNAAQAEAHYCAAIEASFETADVGGAAENIQHFPYNSNNYKQSIGVAKVGLTLRALRHVTATYLPSLATPHLYSGANKLNV